MRIGVVFPQTEIGADPLVIREFAQAVEALGFDHLVAYDHVLGADPARWQLRPGAYTHETMFHEPLVLFGYLAGVTRQLEFATGILILPQRQTALVAKQAAAVDVLSGGRFRLGVGVGWNEAEYAGLREDFHTRGRRIEEQIALLRALWAEPVVNFEGTYDRVIGAGINPLPPRRSIPIWLGGTADVVIERVGRVADGWFPQERDPARLAERIERVRSVARSAGRDPAVIGFQAGIQAASRDAVERAGQFEAAGATHLSVSTMGSGFQSPQQHLDALRRFIEAMPR
ncbi:MAG: LLM class F420-dependent oxidoreductase [Dehalococcoidia bacterium]|nr:LLM class F420-dependent oxidoreductase [Dehalococcoidia bacterium]